MLDLNLWLQEVFMTTSISIAFKILWSNLIEIETEQELAGQLNGTHQLVQYIIFFLYYDRLMVCLEFWSSGVL